MSITRRLFERAFDSTENTLEYNPGWTTTAEYLGRAVDAAGPYAISMKPGAQAKSTTPDGRRILFYGTHIGTLAVFERFTTTNGPLSDDQYVLVTNQPRAMTRMHIIPIGAITEASAELIFTGNSGTPGSNIGTWIENLCGLLFIDLMGDDITKYITNLKGFDIQAGVDAIKAGLKNTTAPVIVLDSYSEQL